jgi:hypothetical protein
MLTASAGSETEKLPVFARALNDGHSSDVQKTEMLKNRPIRWEAICSRICHYQESDFHLRFAKPTALPGP